MCFIQSAGSLPTRCDGSVTGVGHNRKSGKKEREEVQKKQTTSFSMVFHCRQYAERERGRGKGLSVQGALPSSAFISPR